MTVKHTTDFTKFVMKKGAEAMLPTVFGLGKVNAKFMGYFEQKKLMKPSNSGLVLDGAGARLSENDSFRNLAMIATTGWGKTSGFIIPNILLQNTGSMVITDPSGALFAQTSGELARRGYDVRMLNPLDLAQSIRFNPFSGTSSYSQIDEIAHILVKSANPDPKDPFWNQGAETIISILGRTLRNHPKRYKYANLANVLHLLNNFEDGSPLNKIIAEYADPQTFAQYKGFISNAPNTLQGLLSTAKVSLKAVADPDIARLTSYNDFDFAKLRQQKTVLFLVFPETVDKTVYLPSR